MAADIGVPGTPYILLRFYGHFCFKMPDVGRVLRAKNGAWNAPYIIWWGGRPWPPSVPADTEVRPAEIFS